MQEVTGVVDRREIRIICSTWNKNTDKCLVKLSIKQVVCYPVSATYRHKGISNIIEGPYFCKAITCQSTESVRSCSYNLWQHAHD